MSQSLYIWSDRAPCPSHEIARRWINCTAVLPKWKKYAFWGRFPYLLLPSTTIAIRLYHENNTITAIFVPPHTGQYTSRNITLHLPFASITIRQHYHNNTTAITALAWHPAVAEAFCSEMLRGILAMRVHAEQPHHWAGLHHLTYDCGLSDACPPKKYFQHFPAMHLILWYMG